MIEGLNHVSIRAADIERSRDFYVGVLGFVEGPRPPFPFPGYWLYCGDSAALHIVGAGAGLEDYLGERATGGGAVDHIAFQARDRAAVRQRLEQLGVDYREREVPLLNLGQLFITDPDGVQIELNFPAGAAA